MTAQEASLSRIIRFLREKISQESDPEVRQRLMQHRLQAEHDLQNPLWRIY